MDDLFARPADNLVGRLPVACLLATVPYLLLRGPVNRIARVARSPAHGALRS